MVKHQNSNQKNPSQPVELRPVDIYFAQYSESHQNPTTRLVHLISVVLIIFSIMGLLWAIPFPHLKFLGSYNGFFNWASFFIAFSIYYYYKLSPVLSYFMLLMLMVFSYGVIQLAGWEKAGGPALWLLCSILLVASCIGLFIGRNREGKKSSILDDLRSLLIGPVWLMHFVLKKLSIKY